MIPEYDVVVIDEAHELVSRVTQAATDELSPAEVDRAAAARQRHVEGTEADDLADAGDALRDAIDESQPGPDRRGARRSSPTRWPWSATPPGRCVSAFPEGRRGDDADAGRPQAKGWVQEMFATAERMAAELGEGRALDGRAGPTAAATSCASRRSRWGARCARGCSPRRPSSSPRATLKLGGDFDAVATASGSSRRAGLERARRTDEGEPWRGLDVGSPFDYGQQAILYVAAHLPPPGRDGLAQAQLDEIIELVDAADGRTLGLFSSRRAAEAAAEDVREPLPHLTTLAQGDAQLPELATQFVGDPHTSLFGTLSLWQGLDVPGRDLPAGDHRPDPVPAARRPADVARASGPPTGPAATASWRSRRPTPRCCWPRARGRLIRTTTDRGVVAVLDPRLVTARYGSFLRGQPAADVADDDPAVVRKALARLSGTAADRG